jgi:hypothetical protein
LIPMKLNIQRASKRLIKATIFTFSSDSMGAIHKISKEMNKRFALFKY